MKTRTLKEILTICSIILLFSCVIFAQYIWGGYYFFNNSMLSDIIRANVSCYYEIYDNLTNNGGFWSWTMGIGTSQFSHADSFFDPFIYIVFLRGRQHICDMLIWMFLCKLLCEGISFYTLARYWKFSGSAVIVSSVLYAFSGYSLIMGSNFALGTILVYIPLILLGIEKGITNNKFILLFISLWLTCVSSYYFFYITVIAVILYTIIRLIILHKFSVLTLLKFATIGVLVVMCSMFALLPQAELVLQSSRVGETSDITTGIWMFLPSLKALATTAIRSFSNNMLGNYYDGYLGKTVNAASDYFQQSTFAGSFFLFAFLTWYKSNTKKTRYLLPLLFAAICSIPFFSYLCNALSTINMRWMCYLPVFQCLLVAQMLSSTFTHGLDIILYWKSYCLSAAITFGGALILCYHALSSDRIMLFNQVVIHFAQYSLLIILAYLLYKVPALRKYKRGKYLCVLGLMLLDLVLNYHETFLTSKAVTHYSEEENFCYDDTSGTIISSLMDTPDQTFRINKDFDSVMCQDIPSLNDAMVQRYYGLKNYNSLANNSYATFLKKSGCYCTIAFAIPRYKAEGIDPDDIVGAELNYINGVEDRYNLMAYLGTRYFLTKDNSNNVAPYFQKLDNQNGITIYENPYYMPFIFANEDSLSENTYLTLTDSEKDLALLTTTITTNGRDDYHKPSLSQALENISRQQNSVDITNFQSDHIKGTILVSDNASYLSTTIPYDQNWSILIDGVKVKTEKVNIGFLGCKIASGKHTIELQYTPRAFFIGIKISVTSMIVAIILFVVVFVYKHNNKNKKRLHYRKGTHFA